MSIVTDLEKINHELFHMKPEEVFNLISEVSSENVLDFIFNTTYRDLFPTFVGKYKEAKKSGEKYLILKSFYSYLSTRYGLFYSTETAERKNERLGMWKYISFSLYDFIEKIDRIMEITKVDSFFDVGCGAGDKLILAANFLKRTPRFVCGVEYQKEYVDRFVKYSYVFNLSKNNIYNMNAFKLTSDDVKNFDFFYFYMPMRDEEKLKKLYRHIFNIAKEGSYFIDVYYPFLKFLDFEERKNMWSDLGLYQKVNGKLVAVKEK